MKKLFLSVIAIGALLGSNLSGAIASEIPVEQTAASAKSDQSGFYKGWDVANDAMNKLTQAVSLTTGSLEPALVQSICDTIEGKSGTALEKTLTWLGDHGVDYGTVKGIADSKILKFAPYIIDGLTGAIKGINAWQTGDKEAFEDAITDFIISTTANLVGEAVKVGVEAAIAAGTIGVGALPGFFIAEGAGIAASEGAKWLLNKFLKDSIKELVGKMWDAGHKTDTTEVSPLDLEELTGGDGDGSSGKTNGGKNGKGAQGIKAHKWGN